jgi:hypothetical protein
MLFDKFGAAEFVISEVGKIAFRLPYTRNEALRDGVGDPHERDRYGGGLMAIMRAGRAGACPAG